MNPRPESSCSALTRALVRSLPLLLLGACAATRPAEGRAHGQWLEPSPSLRSQIDAQAARLPWASDLAQRVELIQWFAGVGEPAYPVLLELAADGRPEVSGAAFAALGATGDSRLVPHLLALPALPAREGAQDDIELERARALLRLGEWSRVPELIAGLRDERLYTRAVCVKTLADATHERFGYDATADPKEREAAVQRWEQWWSRRSADPMLAQVRDEAGF